VTPRSRLRWSDWPWAAKLALLLGLLAVLPLTVVTLAQELSARSGVLAANRAQDLQQARNTAQTVDRYLSSVLSDLQVLALNPGTVRLLAAAAPPTPELRRDVATALRQMRDTHGFDALYLTDSGGTVLLATEERLVGRSYVAARFFLDAAAGIDSIGEPRYDPQEGKVFLHVSAPVRAAGGPIVGTAVGRVTLSRIDEILQADTDFAGRREHGALWDADGIRLSEPAAPQLRFHPFEPLPRDTASQLIAEGRFGPRTRELLEAAKAANPSDLAPGLVKRSRWLLYDAAADPHLLIDREGRRVHATLVPLTTNRWLYGIFTPEAAVLAAVREQTRRNLAVASLTGLLAVAAGFAAARWASRPLRLVGEAANAIAAGDMTRRVGLLQHDEVGRLGAAFDAMADALAQKEAELRGNADRLEQRVEEQTAALSAAAAELRALFAAMRDAIFIFDDEGRCLKVAPTRAASNSPVVNTLRGRRLADVFSADQAAYFLAQIHHALESWQTVHVEYELVVNGTGLWLEAAISPLLERSVVWVARDITWRKRTEEERRELLASEQEARRRAEEANRIKDEFLSTVSHELRTPLNAILGWAWLLTSGNLDKDREATRRAVGAIERNAKAQSQIIDDLLDVSRIITGKLRLKMRRVDLAQVIEAAVDAMRPAVEAKEIRLDCLPTSDAVPVSGDPSRLQQVIWNLLSNAVKFTPPQGRIEIRLERAGTQAQISVKDDGIGIRADFLDYVFDRFRQADSSTTRQHGGLGLGLAIVRHLVELHGGTVQAASAGEGKGSTFTVQLPLTPLRAQRELPGVLAGPGGQETAGLAAPDDAAADIRGLQILLVDDEADLREMLPAALESLGAHVTAAASAEEALAALESSPFDALVADIGMPEMDGYELIRRLRSRGGRAAGLPAIALTAYAGEADRRRALDAGFQIHLAKPVEPHQLAVALASLAGLPQR
jgi:PAS domain S-box-containing protein